jgi:hypothetical protein
MYSQLLRSEVMSESRRLSRKQPINYLEVYHLDTGDFVGSVVDITTKGIRLYGEKPLELGRKQRLRLISSRIPDAKVEITFEGVCVWCKECTGNLLAGSYGTGFEFSRISEDSLCAIEDVLQSSWFRDWRQLPDYETIRRESGFPVA